MPVIVTAGPSPPNITMGTGGAHGATVIGMHGMGVRTPNAAAVAWATSGLAGELHMPKVKIFNMGTKSIITAGGPVTTMVRVAGNTTSEEGADPIAHIMVAVRMVVAAMPTLPSQILLNCVADLRRCP